MSHYLGSDDVSFVEGLFDLISEPTLHISLDAIKTMRYLFIDDNNDNDKRNKEIYEYFDKNADWLFLRFNALINSDNTINKRQSFNLLNELLLKPNNFDILMRYITKKENLLIAKRILNDEFIKSKTDKHDHNLIIDDLLEKYFEDAGPILEYIASRSNLSNLLLNHTFITRLDIDDHVGIDLDDIKDDITTTHKKDIGSYLGISSSNNNEGNKNNIKNTSNLLSLPPPKLEQMSSTGSCASDVSYIETPNGTRKIKTRYSGDDIPCFKRSPQHTLSITKVNNNNDENKNDDNDENEDNITERALIFELISLINRSCSDEIALYSFNVLSILLTTNKEESARFLLKNYDELIIKFRQLIRIDNHNKLRQKQFLGLLTELLLENSNSSFRKKFKSGVINLKIIMNLLKSKNETIVYDAFHIFAIFATSPKKTREIHIVLWRNTKQNNLISFVNGLLPNRSQKYENWDNEKQTVIENLNKLPTPKTDESYLRLPILQ